ncbi:MAG: protein kinase [Archangiaceae bacterium]|nr:protein kinase [Archangiaceae bacterium]
MGMVFEALDRESHGRVAVKMLRFASADALVRFKSEFRDFQNLSHPNLVSLGELVAQNGQWFFTMELVNGSSFLEHVRAGTSRAAGAPTLELSLQDTLPPLPAAGAASGALVDEGRLRDAVGQLAAGLWALHAAGKVHRDIKPNNVLATTSGRVVILDYGLATDAHDPRQLEPPGHVVGTPAYMAPEQAAARRTTTASDWYAVGVLLFEALTGRLPFFGSVSQVLAEKQLSAAPRVLDCAPQADPQLAALTDALLATDPNQRPDGPAVLRHLGRGDGGSDPQRSLSTSHAPLFVGRAAPLAALQQRFARLRSGTGTFCCLEGESGLGKTTLVRHFTRTLKREHPDAWVLEGACYQRESAPYKGFDGAIDVLSELLLSVPRRELQALLPHHAELLPELFPALARVPALAELPRRAQGQSDPVALRAQLFRAVRELLRRVAERRPLVFVLDDLQWADRDTWELLETVLGGTEAPRILWLALLRQAREPAEPELGRHLERLGCPLDRLELGRLSPEEGEQLAAELLSQQGLPATSAAQLSAEASGQPLFIDALARYASSRGGPAQLTLDEVLWLRSRRLDRDAQRILELVALSNGSLSQEVVARAAELDFSLLARQVGALRVAHLVRSTGVRALDTVTPFHDRVRSALRDRLEPDLAVALHRRLAVSLEASKGADPEALLWHWAQTGDLGRAAGYALAAAAQAVQRLAFDRAVTLYEEALKLDPPPAERRLPLLEALGLALTHAGRGPEAAERFLQAAELADPVAALELKRRAADQLLRSGHLARGVETVREVLRTVDVELPTTPARAVLSLLAWRLRLRLRGLDYREREQAELPAAELLKVDATWAAAQGLSMVDVISGAQLQTQNLLQALNLGEPRRIARALAMEAALRSTAGVSALVRARALHLEAQRIAERLDETNLLGTVTSIEGVIHFQGNRWADALLAAQRAHELLSKKGLGVSWELTTTRLFWLSSLFYLGQLKTLCALLPEWLDDSVRRGDRFASTGLRTSHLSIAWLLADRPDEAQRHAALAMEQWPTRGYLAQHYYALVSSVAVDLYRGDPGSALRRMRDDWPRLSRAQLLRVQFLRVEANHLLGRCAVAAGDFAEARRCAERLRREKTVLGSAFADALEAECELERAAALEKLERAMRGFADQQMGLYAAVTRVRLGERSGQPTQRAEGLSWLRAQGAAVPERIAQVYGPAGRS